MGACALLCTAGVMCAPGPDRVKLREAAWWLGTRNVGRRLCQAFPPRLPLPAAVGSWLVDGGRDSPL